ncbi:MAG: hypothetical protein HQL21_06505 [Candidatus Omnitrophica bacterium]|nr:hypothetical protein [Candidatus Omnitrophota bacterium]
MSIIHDALKKVQEKNAKEAPAKAPASTASPATAPLIPTAPQAPQENRTVIFLLGTLIVVIVMYGIITNIPKRPGEQITITASQIPVTQVQQKGPVSVPMPSSALTQTQETPTQPPEPVAEKPLVDPNDPLSSLRIEGIMDMGDGKKVALINGNMYEEGQTIYGRIITEITLDSVMIMDDGKKRILPVKPPKP